MSRQRCASDPTTNREGGFEEILGELFFFSVGLFRWAHRIFQAICEIKSLMVVDTQAWSCSREIPSTSLRAGSSLRLKSGYGMTPPEWWFEMKVIQDED